MSNTVDSRLEALDPKGECFREGEMPPCWGGTLLGRGWVFLLRGGDIPPPRAPPFLGTIVLEATLLTSSQLHSPGVTPGHHGSWWALALTTLAPEPHPVLTEVARARRHSAAWAWASALAAPEAHLSDSLLHGKGLAARARGCLPPRPPGWVCRSWLMAPIVPCTQSPRRLLGEQGAPSSHSLAFHVRTQPCM